MTTRLLMKSTLLAASLMLIGSLANAQTDPADQPPAPATSPTPETSPQQQPGAYPQQQPGAYPQQQPGAYPQQQPGAYPQQQPGAYPQQQPGAYPQQQPGAYPQQQPGAYPQQQPGAYPQQQPMAQQPVAPQAAEPVPEENPQRELKGFAFGPRLGFVAAGSGTDKFSCSGSDCTGYTGGSYDYDHKGGIVLGADFFGQLSELIRLGGGLLYTMSNDTEYDGVSDDYSTGSVLSTDVILELTPRVGRSAWLTPRLQLGPSFLFASGDLQSDLEDGKQSCKDNQLSGCSSFDNPHIGFNFALGFGALFAVGDKVRLRGDALFEYYSIKLISESVPGYSAEVSEKVTGSRLLLLGGLEI